MTRGGGDARRRWVVGPRNPRTGVPRTSWDTPGLSHRNSPVRLRRSETSFAPTPRGITQWYLSGVVFTEPVIAGNYWGLSLPIPLERDLSKRTHTREIPDLVRTRCCAFAACQRQYGQLCPPQPLDCATTCRHWTMTSTKLSSPLYIPAVLISTASPLPERSTLPLGRCCSAATSGGRRSGRGSPAAR